MLRGSLGLSLVGETVPFLRDPVSFVTDRLARYGAVFRTNVLAQPTVVACTYASALDVLHPSSGPSAEAGDACAEFLGPLYPVAEPTAAQLRLAAARRSYRQVRRRLLRGRRAQLPPTIATIARDALVQLDS